MTECVYIDGALRKWRCLLNTEPLSRQQATEHSYPSTPATAQPENVTSPVVMSDPTSQAAKKRTRRKKRKGGGGKGEGGGEGGEEKVPKVRECMVSVSVRGVKRGWTVCVCVSVNVCELIKDKQE